uniref:heme attachment to plastid cytochrome c n=1 Tax=Watanabea sichuanensis TaxID=2704660 RepID=UPI0024112C83|nr:heme attachment to plastid cytochrome c [Watanabea sichuanensis]WDY13197.1 heme attachment to plastid cytochrome c [Watanabea sichuanensis]
MMYSQIQSFLMPFSFGLLLILMLMYWIQATLFSQLKYKKTTTLFLGIAISSLTTLLVLRWVDSGHFPLSNLYESLVFLSWSFLLSHVLLQSFSANELLGVVTSPMALFTYGFASFSLPKEMQQATALVPALQSNWLMMHVSIMVLSYAALLCGSLLSMTFLVLTSDLFGKLKEETTTILFTPLPLATVFAPIKSTSHPSGNGQQMQDLPYTNKIDLMSKNESPSPYPSPAPTRQGQGQGMGQGALYKEPVRIGNIASTLDNLSYRLLGLGFPLLTVGILSGAVWANEAWGSYWSWDPKETWALITWLVFAIYLHARITKGWVGKKPALIATIGFFVVWFCYLGVNLLGTGLHSYGWFSNKL